MLALRGFMQGCMAVLTAVRDLRRLPVQKEIVFPATVIDRSNLQQWETPVDSRNCPKWEDAVKL